MSSRDHTVLPAHPCVLSTHWMNHTRLCHSQPKLVLIYRPWRDGRLSWPGQREWWVHSRPRIVRHRLLRFLTVQTDTPPWANRCKQPARCCCLEWQCMESNSQPFELCFDMLTTTWPSHNQRMINIPQYWQMAYQNSTHHTRTWFPRYPVHRWDHHPNQSRRNHRVNNFHTVHLLICCTPSVDLLPTDIMGCNIVTTFKY